MFVCSVQPLCAVGVVSTFPSISLIDFDAPFDYTKTSPRKLNKVIAYTISFTSKSINTKYWFKERTFFDNSMNSFLAQVPQISDQANTLCIALVYGGYCGVVLLHYTLGNHPGRDRTLSSKSRSCQFDIDTSAALLCRESM